MQHSFCNQFFIWHNFRDEAIKNCKKTSEKLTILILFLLLYDTSIFPYKDNKNALKVDFGYTFLTLRRSWFENHKEIPLSLCSSYGIALVDSRKFIIASTYDRMESKTKKKQRKIYTLQR